MIEVPMKLSQNVTTFCNKLPGQIGATYHSPEFYISPVKCMYNMPLKKVFLDSIILGH